MAVNEVFSVSEIGAVLENEPISSDLKLRASRSRLNQEIKNPSEREDELIFPPDVEGEIYGEDDGGGLRRAGKKIRLTVNQVKRLEKYFDVENKLEPQRKMVLAKELGLQPRQVAIWFQNRRARWKTKQLEKDYGSLKPNYDKLMSDYANLLQQNEEFKTKIEEMKEELLKREKKRKKMGSLEKVEAMAFQVAELDNQLSNSDSNPVCNLAMAIRGEQGDARSDNQENHLSIMEATYTAQSDFSQNEEDDFTRTLFPQCFPRLEEEEELSQSCDLGFLHDEQMFCFWPYFSTENEAFSL